MSTSSFQIITYIVTTIIASSLVLILLTPLGKVGADNGANLVPPWIKHDALWWSQGSVTDSDFVNGMQYLIQQGIMTIPQTPSSSSSSQSIPSWIKNNAGWWAQGQISDDEFVKGIQYLIQNGMMKIS